MKIRLILSCLTFLSFVLILSACDTRPIPGDHILTLYNSELEPTKRISPMETLYIKVSALGPNKYYKVRVLDSDGNEVSYIEAQTDATGMIDVTPLWYDVGLTRETLDAIPTLEEPDGIDPLPFTINVKSLDDDDTDFSQDMWVLYTKNSDTNPDDYRKPVIYACYENSYDGKYYPENAFEETGSKKGDGSGADSDKTKVYVKADSVPTKIAGSDTDVTKVDFYIVPFTGDALTDGFELDDTDFYIIKKTGVAVNANDPNNKFIPATLLWDLTPGGTGPVLINPDQDNMAYSIIMDLDRDGIFDLGIDTDTDGLADRFIDGIDGLGVPGFIVQNTPANDLFVTIKDGSSETANIVNSIPESGVNDSNLYFNMENISLPSGFDINTDSVYVHLVDNPGTLTSGNPIGADLRNGGRNELTATLPLTTDIRFLPYIENIEFLNTDSVARPHTFGGLPVADGANKKLDIVIAFHNGANMGPDDIFMSDAITIVDVIADPDYATCAKDDESVPPGYLPTIYFDESNTEDGDTIVYLTADNNDGNDYNVYVVKDKPWTDGDYLSGELFKVTGNVGDTAEGTAVKIWDLDGPYKVINPDISENTYDLVIDNDLDGVYDEASDDILTIVILNTRANAYPRVSYANIASGGSFGNTYAQHWTLYSEYCDYRDEFKANGLDTNPTGGGYGVKSVFNPYFKWFCNPNPNPDEVIASIYAGLVVDVYIVNAETFDLANYGNEGELSDAIDVTGRHSSIPVQPSCFNGVGMRTIWHAPMTPGSYYVIVDVNRNQRIDEGTDIIDAVNKQGQTILDNAEIVGFSVK